MSFSNLISFQALSSTYMNWRLFSFSTVLKSILVFPLSMDTF